jgi:hypothetical protein
VLHKIHSCYALKGTKTPKTLDIRDLDTLKTQGTKTPKTLHIRDLDTLKTL